MPTAIKVGDTVNVTLQGARPTSLSQYEVMSLPTAARDYWEFEGPKGEVVATRDPIVTKT